jgi:hypothetical protein
MLTQNDLDVLRQKYREWNAQFDRPYMPLPHEKPGLGRRILAALRGSRAKRAAPTTGHGRAQPTCANAAAK